MRFQPIFETVAHDGALSRRRGAHRGFAAFVLLLALVAATPASAFRLTPIVEDFQPTGREAVKNFTVTNTTPERIAVEIRMMKRAIRPDGQEILTPEDKDFVVFPTQVALEPGKSQAVQVRWVGDPEPKTELAYRIIAEQLPVELDKARQDIASIRLLIKYEGSVYILPKGAKADVSMTGLRPAKGTDGKPGLQVTLVNKGLAHGIVREAKLALTDSAGGKVTLSGAAAKALENINVLAGGTRNVVLPWPAGLKAGEVKGTLEAKVER
ncbi:fimbria/pilus periplasmic chaperone [Thalassospiraceae bacterium LMO-SO8]|nr:fimbria/pilus periplasmic chaperone [Alphaproteobacteria bacterium LMO-S08]WND76791.1 fimbria/pilus periplasmic chaperone [Thalassospiraceae bacterium LMO-SO8]